MTTRPQDSTATPSEEWITHDGGKMPVAAVTLIEAEGEFDNRTFRYQGHAYAFAYWDVPCRYRVLSAPPSEPSEGPDAGKQFQQDGTATLEDLLTDLMNACLAGERFSARYYKRLDVIDYVERIERELAYALVQRDEYASRANDARLDMAEAASDVTSPVEGEPEFMPLAIAGYESPEGGLYHYEHVGTKPIVRLSGVELVQARYAERWRALLAAKDAEIERLTNACAEMILSKMKPAKKADYD